MYLCEKAVSVNSPPILWIKYIGQGYHGNQLFSITNWCVQNDLLSMWITSLRLIIVSMHVYAWNVNILETISNIIFGPIGSTVTSNHSTTSASQGVKWP